MPTVRVVFNVKLRTQQPHEFRFISASALVSGRLFEWKVRAPQQMKSLLIWRWLWLGVHSPEFIGPRWESKRGKPSTWHGARVLPKRAAGGLYRRVSVAPLAEGATLYLAHAQECRSLGVGGAMEATSSFSADVHGLLVQAMPNWMAVKRVSCERLVGFQGLLM